MNWLQGARAMRRASLGAALGLLSLLTLAAWQRRWIADDAFIDLVVVRNVVAGNGPVFHPGERVEAFTNPMWVLILAALVEVTNHRVPIELIALWGSLVSMVSGLGLGLWASARKTHEARLVLPFSALVMAALPVTWDFATSGLETGLCVLWLGLSHHLLRRALEVRDGRREQVAFVVWAVGPLVRPDLGLYSLAFGLAWGFAGPLPSRIRIGRLIGLALLGPVSLQVLRMGYFGLLVPNTALAKEASLSNWSQGVAYLWDFARTYWMPFPIALVGAVLGEQIAVARRREDRTTCAWLVAAPLGATLHAVYIVRVGGDFMHGRMWLPAVMGLCLPVMSVTVWGSETRRLWVPVAWALLAVWAASCGLWLRPAFRRPGEGQGINDERMFYVRFTGNSHPVRVEDYRGSDSYRDAEQMLALASQARAMHLKLAITSPGVGRYERFGHSAVPYIPLVRGFAFRAVAPTGYLGVPGFLVQSRDRSSVRYVDVHGLSDPIASHLTLTARSRPGHEKTLSEPWVMGRFARPEFYVRLGDPSLIEASLAAHEVLTCGPVAELIEAVSAPLTARRFMQNLVGAVARTRLRIPQDPREARRHFCTTPR